MAPTFISETLLSSLLLQISEDKDTDNLSFKGKSLALIPQAPGGGSGPGP